jgi:transcriptional regulator with XRE-family HTH domain
MGSMAILDPKKLVEARRAKGWTQVQLSEATKPRIVVSTISRIERGKPTRIRESTLKQLGRALGVDPQTLCQGAEPEREVVKLRVESAARNALTLVALRYGVSREDIVEIAPLLFHIAAKECLQERRKRVAEVRDAANALFFLQGEIRHLPPRWPIDEGALSSEEKSIEARDLFGTQVAEEAGQFLNEYADEYDEAEHNPFASFLRNALAKIGDSQEEAESFRWCPPLWPRYEICAKEAAELVGGDTKAAQAILNGAAALHEMPKGSPAERAEWGRAEFDRKYGDLGSLLECVIEPSRAKDDGTPAESNAGAAP